MNLFENRCDVEIYLAEKDVELNADALPAKILLTLECRTRDDFVSRLNKFYSGWLPSIERSAEGAEPLLERIDFLLSNVCEKVTSKFRTERFSLQRDPW